MLYAAAAYAWRVVSVNQKPGQDAAEQHTLHHTTLAHGHWRASMPPSTSQDGSVLISYGGDLAWSRCQGQNLCREFLGFMPNQMHANLHTSALGTCIRP